MFVVIDKLKKLIRWYLSKVGFKLADKTTYLKRNIADILVAFVYSALSIGCVIADKASLLVFFMNDLCMCRIIIKNTIESSKLTDVLKERLEDDGLSDYISVKNFGKFHFYIKGCVQVVIAALSLLLMFLIWFDTSILITKVFTCFLILFVWLDDLESACVNIWSAEINPLEKFNEQKGSDEYGNGV